MKKFVDKDYDKAVEYLDEAVTLHPDTRRLGRCLDKYAWRNGCFRRRRRHSSGQSRSTRTTCRLYAPLTRLLSLRGRTPRGLRPEWRKGLELNPYDVDLKYLRRRPRRFGSATTKNRPSSPEDRQFRRCEVLPEYTARAGALNSGAGRLRERAARLFGEYYADRSNNIQLRSAAGRELSEVRLAEYTLRTLRPALP
ncbi:MAG: hypothetical protein R2748_10525 [Bryobacterales bacterium]